jgi:hypothetical protein
MARRGKKIRYNFSSLPFPRGASSTSYVRDWRKSFKSTLIHWAATLEDPFGTNVVMEDIVAEIWKEVFPSIAKEVDGSSREAIMHVVRHYSFMLFSPVYIWILGGRCAYRLA